MGPEREGDWRLKEMGWGLGEKRVGTRRKGQEVCFTSWTMVEARCGKGPY